jgi:cytochrome c oxidase subunit II
MIGRRMKSLTAGLMAGLWTITVAAQSQVDFQTPQSPVAREVYDLHLVILGICVVIFVGVFGVMLYSIIKHRKSVGRQAAHFHENIAVEIIWTIAPLFVLVVMMIPATKTLLAMRNASSPEMTIKTTGYDGKRHYKYLQPAEVTALLNQFRIKKDPMGAMVDSRSRRFLGQSVSR